MLRRFQVYDLLFVSSHFEEGISPEEPLSRRKRDLDSAPVFSHTIAPDLTRQFQNLTNDVYLYDLHNKRKQLKLSEKQSNRTLYLYNKLSKQFGDPSVIAEPHDSGRTEFPATDGLIYQIIANDPSLLLDPEVRDVVRQMTGFGSKPTNATEIVDVMRVRILVHTS